MKLRHLNLMIIVLFVIIFIRYTNEEEQEEQSIGQNDTSFEVIRSVSTTISIKTATSTLSTEERMQAMKSRNITSNNTLSNKVINERPEKLFEYLRCRQLSSKKILPSAYSCPYDFEEDAQVCWDATLNGTMASTVTEYDHGQNYFYDSVHYGIKNCTLERFCHSNGTWEPSLPRDVQCKLCFGGGRPVTFNFISILIETTSLSLSLISLTIAVLCMMNVKRSHPYIRPTPRYNFLVIPSRMPLICKCFLSFRRLHLPRNLLHMHLFVAFIFRSIVKLVFIHLIVGGYTRTMIVYTEDKCGNIEIINKSPDLFHVIGCRLLSSLFWYTDAVSQTFIFCEAMFLFTALTSHLFRDRGCLPFVLWGWFSPLVWLTMWIVSHVITDRLKKRSTCWLEDDKTTYFYYYFYIPYAFYLLVNFGIFLYLVRLLYSKYQSNNAQTTRTGNRHLIKSILILIPLFGLHSLFVMWFFYQKNQGYTIWYYISVTFKAIFGDLQGFFTSLIYFYFNTEIRYEVVRQVQRTILSNDSIRRSSAGDTLSTRLSTFRRSITRYRHSSTPNRMDRQRPSRVIIKPTRDIWWKKWLTFICPCLIKIKTLPDQPQQQIIEQNNFNESSPAVVPELNIDGELVDISSPLTVTQIPGLSKVMIDNDGLTCDTDLIKNEHEEDELLTDENDVTYQNSTSFGDLPSTVSIRLNNIQRNRSNSDGFVLKNSFFKHNNDDDNQSLR